jgi:hypothetical protein
MQVKMDVNGLEFKWCEFLTLNSCWGDGFADLLRHQPFNHQVTN